MISIKKICEEYYSLLGEENIRRSIKQAGFKIEKINDLQHISLSDYEKLKYYLSKTNGVLIKNQKIEDKCQMLDPDREARKKLFMEKYGPHTEKWFDPKWWPSYEDITPSIFIGLEDDQEEDIA